jgi:hypothetical protein
MRLIAVASREAGSQINLRRISRGLLCDLDLAVILEEACSGVTWILRTEYLDQWLNGYPML